MSPNRAADPDGARIVSYSSVGHWRSPVNFDSTDYEPWVAYGQSKSADALLAVALDARLAGRGIHAYSVHPGGIMTDLQRNMPREELLARQWIDEEGNPNPLSSRRQLKAHRPDSGRQQLPS